MFQWVSYGIENIGNYVDNNYQCVNYYYFGGDCCVVLLVNSVDQLVVQFRLVEYYFSDYCQGEYGGKLQVEMWDYWWQGVVQDMVQQNFVL